MKKKRIVVTGMGLVSCFGMDVDQFYESLLQGKSGVSLIEEFPCEDYATRFAGVIRNFDVGDYMPKKQARRVDPFIRYGVVAGKRALEQALLTEEKLKTIDPYRAGVIIGSGMGGMTSFSNGVDTLLEQGYKKLTPFFVPFIITNMAGAMLAIDIGFKGPNFSVSTACATSNFSIHLAAEQIALGKADLMICGGSEAPMSPIGLAGFVVAKTLSTRNDAPEKASRPWDKQRDGFVMGEGAGVLVLESLEHALARKAPIFAEYLGSAINCDAYHITGPREDGEVVALCIKKALEDANIAPTDVNYINAHATSTIMGDLCEIRGVKKAFPQSHHKNIKINGTKSMTGHCLGAAGGIEAIATIQAIQVGKVHQTLNLENPESELGDLDPVQGKAQNHIITTALSSSFGFGGHNSVIVLAPYKE